MTSVSIVSRSLSAACGRITGGGCSTVPGTGVEGRGEPGTFYAFNIPQSTNQDSKSTYALHHGRARFLLRCCSGFPTGEERAEEGGLLFAHLNLEVSVVVDHARGELTCLWVDLVLWWRRLVGIESVLHDLHRLGRFKGFDSQEKRVTYPVARQEVRMGRVDVAGLHRDQVSNELVRRRHRVLEEVDDDRVEPVLKLRIPPECLHLSQQLAQNPDQLVVDQLTALERGLF